MLWLKIFRFNLKIGNAKIGRWPFSSTVVFASTVSLLADEDDLQDVRSAVGDLAGLWKDLGLSLGIRLHVLDAIPFSSPSECLREMLAMWLRQSYNVRTTLACTLSSLPLYYTKCTSLASKGSILSYS